MRKSRQPRCTAAILEFAALKASKFLDAVWNFSRAIFVRHRERAASEREAAWMA
jgi:hypothetical protein